jgi:hypothetical protein
MLTQNANSPMNPRLRPSVVICVIAAAFALLAMIALVSHYTTPSREENQRKASAASDQASERPSSPVAPFRAKNSNPVSDSPAVTSVAGSPPELHTFAKVENITAPASMTGSKPLSVKQKVANLDLVVIGDLSAGEKLDILFTALKNPEAKIRAAALEAVVEVDDRAAIPRLQELAAQTEDPDEKQQLLDAADHLALPSLSEFVAARRAAGQSRPTTSARPPLHGRHISKSPSE